MITEAEQWFVCFDPRASWWVRWLAWGRFNHVRAFAIVPRARIWLFFDVTLGGLTIRAARDQSPEADALINGWSEGCEIVHIRTLHGAGLPMPPLFSCVTAVKHLIGLRGGALRPDALYRHCLANGGRVLDEQGCAGAADPAQPSA